MTMSDADAHHGAAYKVLYERWDPDGCITADKLAALTAKADAVKAWAAGQVPIIKDAYLRAADEIVKRATAILENNSRAAQMLNLSKSIPRPPE